MAKENSRYHITFLRHAESVGNAEGYFQGQSDFPLTDLGREQARALAARWQEEDRRFDRIIASPLSRTRETAEIIADALQLPIEYDEIWMERHNGKVTGMKHEEGRKLLPASDIRNPYHVFAEYGEGDWQLFLRAGEALRRLLALPPAHYLIVAHGAILNYTLKAIVGVPPHANYQGPQFRFGNTAFATVIYLAHAHRWYIEGLNDQHHWSNHG